MRPWMIEGRRWFPIAVGFIGLVAATSARAACPEPVVDEITCSSVVTGQLDPGPWTGSLPSFPLNVCPSDFGNLDSSLGESCAGTLLAGYCISWACGSADRYSCGAPRC